MEIAHRLKACSTIVCGSFIYYHTDSRINSGPKTYSEEYLLKQMIVSLKEQIKKANQKDYVKTLNGYERAEVIQQHMLDGYKVDQFALFFTTVFSRSQWDSSPYKKIHKLIRQIGFTIDDSEEIWNDKNSTYVYPCYAPVYRVLKFLDKYDDKGELLKKKDEEGEEVKKPKRSRKKEALAA
jgi:hypothetical protein